MGSPDPPASRLCKRLFRLDVANDFVSAVTERGSYPFPFRTRKSSPSSPMVPGPRARESRSPLDSRGPLPNRQGASSFYMTARAIVTVQLRLALALATTAGRYRLTGCLSLTAPCCKRRAGLFLLSSPAWPGTSFSRRFFLTKHFI